MPDMPKFFLIAIGILVGYELGYLHRKSVEPKGSIVQRAPLPKAAETISQPIMPMAAAARIDLEIMVCGVKILKRSEVGSVNLFNQEERWRKITVTEAQKMHQFYLAPLNTALFTFESPGLIEVKVETLPREQPQCAVDYTIR